MAEERDSYIKFGINWTKIFSYTPLFCKQLECPSVKLYAPDQFVRIIEDGSMLQHIQWLVMLFILVFHLHRLLIIPIRLNTRSLTTGLVLLSVSIVFILSFRFNPFVLIIVLVSVAFYQRIKQRGQSNEERLMWLGISDTSISSNKLAHWSLKVYDGTNYKIVHSIGSPSSGMGELYVTDDDPTRFKFTATVNLGQGSLKRRSYAVFHSKKELANV